MVIKDQISEIVEVSAALFTMILLSIFCSSNPITPDVFRKAVRASVYSSFPPLIPQIAKTLFLCLGRKRALILSLSQNLDISCVVYYVSDDSGRRANYFFSSNLPGQF
jgi:hypothetical protein